MRCLEEDKGRACRERKEGLHFVLGLGGDRPSGLAAVLFGGQRDVEQPSPS